MLLPANILGMTTHFLYWNSTNPIFRERETEHVLEVNRGNGLLEHDQLHLICPNSGNEQHVIYSVSEAEYRMCRVTNPRPKIVAVCNQPSGRFRYFTLTFRSFSPNPTAIEFKPGHSYYLISTSTQRDLHRRAGGYCQTHNMKMVINVAATGTPAAESVSNTAAADNANINSVNPPTAPGRNDNFRRIKTVTTERSTPASVPVYYYRSQKTPSHSRATDYIYYYSPRDIIQLRLKAKKHAKVYGNSNENETFYKAAKLTSSSSEIQQISIVLLISSLFFINL